VAIQNLDFDNDGFTNIAEIQAFSFPGDGSDQPVGSLTITIEPVDARNAGAK